ncbi:MAG: branched-chain amino acid ABC transporter permease [Alphaproteobacteria bacterium]|nr:branched-chain amino acid ABC transporter permease [Alphaproteobacteria bacterium]
MMRRDYILSAVLLVIAVGLPWLDPPRYLLAQGLLLFCWATVVSQWNLVFGIAGIFSLAQIAIFAVGAYSTAMMGRYLEMNLWYAFPIAGVIGVIFSLLIGLGCLRMRGVYVALLTIAVGQVLFVLIMGDGECSPLNPGICMSFTGGPSGMGGFGGFGWREVLGGRHFIIGDYYSMLGLLILAMAFTFWIIHSRMGLAFKALRDNPELASSRGISRFKYQLLVFALSAFFTAEAGAFFAAHFGSVGPGQLSFTLLLFLISMLIVGGMGRPWGPLLGAFLIMGGDEFLKEAGEWRHIGFGVMLLVFMIFLPDGVAGLIDRVWRRLTTRGGAARAGKAAPAE